MVNRGEEKVRVHMNVVPSRDGGMGVYLFTLEKKRQQFYFQNKGCILF